MAEKKRSGPFGRGKPALVATPTAELAQMEMVATKTAGFYYPSLSSISQLSSTMASDAALSSGGREVRRMQVALPAYDGPCTLGETHEVMTNALRITPPQNMPFYRYEVNIKEMHKGGFSKEMVTGNKNE